MKEELKQLQQRRNARIGWILFVVLIVVCLINNRFVYWWLDSGGRFWQQIFSFSMAGVVLGQVYLLVTWTVMSADKFSSRLIFLAFATASLMSAWLLGYIAKAFPKDQGLNWINREEFYVLGWIPIFFIVIALPLICVRFFGHRVLASKYDPDPPNRYPVTTAGLLITTGVVALALAGAQLPTLMEMPQESIWTAILFISAFLFGGSLLVLLPSVLTLFSDRIGFWIGGPVAMLSVFGLSAGGFYLFALSSRQLRTREIFFPISVIVCAFAILLTGFCIMRLLGYRLMKQSTGSTKPLEQKQTQAS